MNKPPQPLPESPAWAGTAARTGAAVPAPQDSHATAQLQRRVHSQELLGNAQEVEIEHGGAVYRLRQTALGKLILTK